MFQNFFRGSYGIDPLSIVLFIIAALLITVDPIWPLGAILLGYVVYRALSKDTRKRLQELQYFNRLLSRIGSAIMPKGKAGAGGFQGFGGKFGNYKTRFQQRKQYVFVSCPKCKRTLRLPRNKGKLQVTCPVCKDEFLKKT